MSNTNPFKAGDKITITPRNDELAQVLSLMVKAHTDQTVFTLDTVGLATHNELEELLKEPSPEPDAVAFKSDCCGKEFEFSYLDVTLVEA